MKNKGQYGCPIVLKGGCGGAKIRQLVLSLFVFCAMIIAVYFSFGFHTKAFPNFSFGIEDSTRHLVAINTNHSFYFIIVCNFFLRLSLAYARCMCSIFLFWHSLRSYSRHCAYALF